MGYSIKILSNDEFDELPYSHASMAFGLADVKRNSVYVRHSEYPELNKYLLDHEIDHLVEEIPTDEIDGVRYKIPLGALAGGIGAGASALGRSIPAISGAIRSAGTGIGGALASGTKGLGGGFNSLASKTIPALSSGFTGLGSSLAKGINVPAGIPNFLNPSQLAQQNSLNSPFGGGSLGGILGAASKFAPQASNFIQGLLSPFSSKQSGRLQESENPLATSSSAMDAFQQSQASQQAPQQAPQTAYSQQGIPAAAGSPGSSIQGLLGSFGLSPQNLLGVGALGTGLLSKMPDIPPMPPSVEELRSTIKSGGNQVGQLGKQKLTDLLNQQFEPMAEPEIQASLRQLGLEQTKAEDQVRDLYRNLRPGSDPSSDTSFGRDIRELQDQFARAKSDVLANRTRELKQNFDTNRRVQIQQAFGASDSEMQQLMQLAQMDVAHIMAQTGLDNQSAMLFKQTFLNLGSNYLQPPSPFDQFIKAQLAGGLT